ncbi:MAG: hypothetical protein M3162_00850 [Thermoproteota archaeon]|nr:hypothetical protein [Thermoproteota archaeon]
MEIKSILLFSMLAISAVIPAAYAQNSNISQWNNFTSAELGISFQYPDNWNLTQRNTSSELIPDVVVNNGSNYFNYIKPDTRIDTELANVGFEAIAQTFIDTYSRNGTIVQYLDLNSTQIDGNPTATFAYSFGNNPLIIVSKVFLVEQNQMIHTLTYNDLRSSFDSPASQETMNRIIDSFEFQ